jgi:predicted RNA-binding Zn-ribbon protein involved in translation (DUF1610 family)
MTALDIVVTCSRCDRQMIRNTEFDWVCPMCLAMVHVKGFSYPRKASTA